MDPETRKGWNFAGNQPTGSGQPGQSIKYSITEQCHRCYRPFDFKCYEIASHPSKDDIFHLSGFAFRGKWKWIKANWLLEEKRSFSGGGSSSLVIYLHNSIKTNYDFSELFRYYGDRTELTIFRSDKREFSLSHRTNWPRWREIMWKVFEEIHEVIAVMRSFRLISFGFFFGLSGWEWVKGRFGLRLRVRVVNSDASNNLSGVCWRTAREKPSRFIPQRLIRL